MSVFLCVLRFFFFCLCCWNCSQHYRPLPPCTPCLYLHDNHGVGGAASGRARRRSAAEGLRSFPIPAAQVNHRPRSHRHGVGVRKETGRRGKVKSLLSLNNCRVASCGLRCSVVWCGAVRCGGVVWCGEYICPWYFFFFTCSKKRVWCTCTILLLYGGGEGGCLIFLYPGTICVVPGII